jgi:hypothetical protein
VGLLRADYLQFPAVIPCDSIPGTNPDKAGFILPDGDDLVMGQSLTGPKGKKLVLTLKLDRGEKKKYKQADVCFHFPTPFENPKGGESQMREPR